MIDKLTDEQIGKIPEHVKKWVDIGLNTKPFTLDEATPIINNIYEKILKKDKPKIILLLDSPLEAWMAVCMFNSNQVRDQVSKHVWDKVEDPVWNQVRSQVGAQVWNQVSKQVRDQVRTQVRDQAKELKKNFIWPYLDGHYSVNIFAFYDFFINEFGINKDNKLYEIWESSSKLDLIYPLDNICILSQHPKSIIRDMQGRLHNIDGPALEYSEYFKIYSLYGVRFKKELWEKIVSKQMSFKEIMKIKNIEQRYAAIRLINPENLIKESGAKLISDTGRNELYKTKIEDLEVTFLKYSCPSTNRVYMKFVPNEFANADHAQAWSFSLTPDEYKLLKVEA